MNVDYSVIRGYDECAGLISPDKMAVVICGIQDSDRFEMDESGSYILLRGTNVPIAYVGDDSLQLVRFKNRELMDKFYPHLSQIFVDSLAPHFF